MQPYPDGLDCVWVASDRDGQIGAFITAGAGPIPTEALSSIYVPIEEIEGRLCQLPAVSEVRLLIFVKRPDDFIQLAERGLFVYDWTDINRTAREELHLYEPVAIPTEPIAVNSLPSDLAGLANVLKFADIAFAAREALDVRTHLSCIEKESDKTC